MAGVEASTTVANRSGKLYSGKTGGLQTGTIDSAAATLYTFSAVRPSDSGC